MILICFINLVLLTHSAETRGVALHFQGLIDRLVAVAKALQVVQCFHVQFGDGAVEGFRFRTAPCSSLMTATTIRISAPKVQAEASSAIDRVSPEEPASRLKYTEWQVGALYPRLAYELIRPESAFGIYFQKAGYDVPRIPGHQLWILVLASLDFAVEFFLRLAPEWEGTRQESIE